MTGFDPNSLGGAGGGDGGFSPMAAIVVAGIFGVLILGLALVASMNRRH